MDIVYEKSLCFTGHRPERLHGYDPLIEGNRKLLMKLRAVIERMITKKGISIFITGMALGIDMWAGRIVLALKEKHPHIKLVCAIPCENHSARWSLESKAEWRAITEQADYTYYVSEEPYTHWCMQKRNEWMVDNAKFIIAVWDGEKSGTENCIKYAQKRQRNIIGIHPSTYEVTLGV